LFNRPTFPELFQVRLLNFKQLPKVVFIFGIVLAELLQAGCPPCDATDSISVKYEMRRCVDCSYTVGLLSVTALGI